MDIRKPVASRWSLVGHPALRTLGDLGPAGGADDVRLWTAEDRSDRRLQANRALQILLLRLD